MGKLRAFNLKVLKFILSEKATKFCEIFPLLLTVCTAVKSKGKKFQKFVAFSEYMNFNINTSYLIDSYIGFTLKMESVSKNIIFGLKMMVKKSGLKKFILESLHAERWLFLLLNLCFGSLL